MSSSLCTCCLCFFCLLPLLITAQNNRTITLGSSLAAGDESSWVSPYGDFAFGFQQVGTGGFLLAIWFNNIPDKTITWSANRDTLAQRGSKLQLTANGGLVLSDPNGTVMWSLPVSGAAYAALLDSGNFVLADKNSVTLWQSFDHPTDTILPTQIMNQGTALIAQISDTNFSSGRFKLIMQGDGNLVSYTLNWPQDSIEYFPYFATSTVGSGYQLVFKQSGSIYITAKNRTEVAPFLPQSIDPAQDLYQRAILEFDGVFRKYVYPRSSSTNRPMNWTMQDFVPQDICSQMHAIQGGGVCGFNSYCQVGSDQKPKCRCPPGYSFLDRMDQMQGCKPDFTPQSCMEKSQKNQFQLEEMDGTNFAGTDYETFQGISETSCRNSCLSDCLCTAAVFNGTACWKKRFPFSNGWVGSRLGTKTLIKVRIVNSTTSTKAPQLSPIMQTAGGVHAEKEHQTIILTVSVLLGVSVLLNVLFLV